MNITDIQNSEVVIFKPKDGQTEFQVILDGNHDTVWATEQQIMQLFGKARRTIGEHIKNIYEEGELDKESTWREFRQVKKEGKREIARKISIYNLDVVISVGYRVKSQVGVEFRKWATQKLKEFLLQGYSINKQLLETEQQKVKSLKQEIIQLSGELMQTQKTLTDGLLSIISHYSKSFELLNKYDRDELSVENLNKNFIYIINYKDVKKAIQQLKYRLMAKEEASDLFGIEKDIHFKEFLVV